MIVEFKFDKEKDLFNIWETSNSGKHFGHDFTKNVPKEILKICKGKKFSNCKSKLEKISYNLYSKNDLIKDIEKDMNVAWRKIEKKYFKRLENLTNQKIAFTKSLAYLTSTTRCPYKPHWRPPAFYVKIFSSIQDAMQTTGHELMHIHLHNIDWWKRVEKKIGYNKTDDLKEALTELLNSDFRDLWKIRDKGYPNHVKLRKFIRQEWKKEKNFDKLTDNCIKWIKKNGIK